MDYLFAENMIILLCATVGFLFGVYMYIIKKRDQLFASIIVMSTGCIALGRLYQCVYILVNEVLPSKFQIGALGVMAAFGFLFVAGSGIIDGLAGYDKEAMAKRTRLAYIAPLCIVLMYISVAVSNIWMSVKIGYAFCAFVIAAATLYNLRHLLVRDCELLGCLRPYNMAALALGFALMAEMAVNSFADEISEAASYDIVMMVFGIVIGLLVLAIVPLMHMGVKRWKA